MQGVAGTQGRPGLLRLHLLRGEQRQAQGGRRSTAATAASRRAPRPRRTAATSRWPGRCSSTRRQGRAGQAAGQGVRRLLRRERRRDRRGRAVRPAERRAEDRRCKSGLRRASAGLTMTSTSPTTGRDRRRDRSLRRSRAALRRARHRGPAARGRAGVDRDHGRHRRRRWSCPTVEFFSEVRFVEFLTGTEWTPLFARPDATASCRWSSATLVITLIALVVAIPLGLGSAIYLRVRRRPDPPDPQADARGPRRHPHGRLRLLRADRASPRCCRTSGRSATDRAFQNAARRRHRHGHHDHPDVASLSEDAMSAVPRSLREGAYALAAHEDAGRDPGRRAGRAVRHRRRLRARASPGRSARR